MEDWKKQLLRLSFSLPKFVAEKIVMVVRGSIADNTFISLVEDLERIVKGYEAAAQALKILYEHVHEIIKPKDEEDDEDEF